MWSAAGGETTARLLRLFRHTAMLGSPSPDVYGAHEIAAAAGVSEARVRALIARGEIRSIATYLPLAGDPGLADFVAHDEAARAVKALRSGSVVAVPGALGLGRELFAPGAQSQRTTTLPLIVSTSLHGLAFATVLFIASLGFAVADERTDVVDRKSTRLNSS